MRLGLGNTLAITNKVGDNPSASTYAAGLVAKFFSGSFRATIPSGDINGYPLPLSATSNSTIIHGGSGRHVRQNIEYTTLGDSYGFIAIGYFTPPTSGNYYFRTNSDDSSGVWVGNLALEGQTRNASNATVNNGLGGIGQGATEATSAAVPLTTGTQYPIRIVHEEGAGEDNLTFKWSSDSGSNYSTDLSQYFSHAVVNGTPTGTF